MTASKSITHVHRPEQRARTLGRELRSPAYFGIALIALFFGVGGGWVSTAPLAGAVISSGAVSPESRRHAVQHLEGGIIRAIHAAEGTRVNAGTPLLVLDDVDARTELSSAINRVATFAAQEARAKAESEGLIDINFSHAILATGDPAALEAIAREKSRAEARRENDRQRRNIIAQRLEQLAAQVLGLDRQLSGVRTQIVLLEQELGIVDDMVNKGLERLPRLLGLKRSLAERGAFEGELMASIARANEQRAELILQRLNIDVQRLESVQTEFAETRAKRAEAEEQYKKALDRVSRTVIRAPSAGIVLNLRFKTAGGVIKAGEPILDMVPTDDTLLVDGRILPRDVHKVAVGAPAYVIFPSYPQHRLQRIEGKVSFVTADALQDDKTGERYFLAKVAVDRKSLKQNAPEIEMVPGLPAEVYITTAERTLLSYLLQPLRLAIEKGLRES